MSANPNDGVNSTSANGASNAAIADASTATPGTETAVTTLQPETPKPLTPEEIARKEQTKKAGIIAAIVGVVALILFIGLIVFLASDAARTALIRDIVIILSAAAMFFMTIVIGILMVVLIYRIQDLIGFLRGELIPVINNVSNSINNVSGTVNNVTGTVNLVSDNVARPTIKFASMMAGLQQMAKAAQSKVRGEK